MLGIGLPELLLTACVGVIFIGPKQIPGMVVAAVKFIRKIKSFSSDLNRSVEAFMVETELNTIVGGAVFVEESKDLEEVFDKEDLEDE